MALAAGFWANRRLERRGRLGHGRRFQQHRVTRGLRSGRGRLERAGRGRLQSWPCQRREGTSSSTLSLSSTLAARRSFRHRRLRTALCSARVGPPWAATLEEAHPATREARADRAGAALWHARGFNNRPWGLKWRRLAAIRQSRAIRWLWRLLSASSYADLLLLPCTLHHIGSELANDARFK